MWTLLLLPSYTTTILLLFLHCLLYNIAVIAAIPITIYAVVVAIPSVFVTLKDIDEDILKW